MKVCFCYDEDTNVVNGLIEVASKRAKVPESYQLGIKTTFIFLILFYKTLLFNYI